MRHLHYSTLAITGFAGIRERVLVSDRRYFSHAVEDEVFDGFGQCVYLAHAYFTPNGSTGLHYHSDVDIISIFTKGEIAHQGSLGHGERFTAGQVLVQCSGEKGFRHDEQNAISDISGMVQLWCRPSEQSQLTQQHLVFDISKPGLHRIYGGNSKDELTQVVSSTQMDILCLNEQASFSIKERVRLYVFEGALNAIENNTSPTDVAIQLTRGSLCDTRDVSLIATQACKVLIQRCVN